MQRGFAGGQLRQLKSAGKQETMLCGAKIPAKLKNFACRPSHNSIPTEGFRFQWHMTDSNVCSICNATVDSWKHALIDCQIAKCVRAMVGEELVEHMVTITSDDAHLQLVELQSTTSEEQFVKAIVALWSICWVRRKAIHEQQYQSPHSTLCFTNSYLPDLALILEKQHVIRPVVSMHQVQKWVPPESSWVKVNVDAAISRNLDKGALAVIFRDHTGMFLGAST